MTTYFSRKSPKATEARARTIENIRGPQETTREESKVEKKQLQGAIGPLMGDMGGSSVLEDHPSDEASASTPSKAEAGCLEARGRAARNNGGGDGVRRALRKLAQELEDRKEELAKTRREEETGERRPLRSCI